MQPEFEHNYLLFIRAIAGRWLYAMTLENDEISSSVPLIRELNDHFQNFEARYSLYWDFLGDDPLTQALDSYIDSLEFGDERYEIVDGLLDTLSEREARVIVMRFGFDNGMVKTLDEIGQALNISRERVRQIYMKTLSKLTHPSRSILLLPDFFQQFDGFDFD